MCFCLTFNRIEAIDNIEKRKKHKNLENRKIGRYYNECKHIHFIKLVKNLKYIKNKKCPK